MNESRNYESTALPNGHADYAKHGKYAACNPFADILRRDYNDVQSESRGQSTGQPNNTRDT